MMLTNFLFEHFHIVQCNYGKDLDSQDESGAFYISSTSKVPNN